MEIIDPTEGITDRNGIFHKYLSENKLRELGYIKVNSKITFNIKMSYPRVREWVMNYDNEDAYDALIDLIYASMKLIYPDAKQIYVNVES